MKFLFFIIIFIYRQVLYANLQPVPSNFVYNPQFLSEVFTNPHRGGIKHYKLNLIVFM